MVGISIIIPVHNVEAYLKRCVDSCLNQSFKDVEIILVDDCSTDSSAEIMKVYENEYPDKVKCIYLDKNIRQGGARNRGMDIARGEYILFVDSDDWIAQDMCEELYKSAKNNDADVVMCDYFRTDENNDRIVSAFRKQIDFASTLDMEKELILSKCLRNLVWNRLIRKSYLLENQFKFPEGMLYEDIVVAVIWVMCANKINYLNRPLYYYFIRENSTVTSLHKPEVIIDYINSLTYKINRFIEKSMIEKYHRAFFEMIMLEINVAFRFYVLCNHNANEELKRLLNLIKELYPNAKQMLDVSDEFDVMSKNRLYSLIENADEVEKLIYMKKQNFSFRWKKYNKRAIMGVRCMGRKGCDISSEK